MAKSNLNPIFENVSGKLHGRTAKGDQCKQMVLAKHLKQSSHHNRVYIGNPEPRSTPPTAKEMALHTKFRTCVQAANERAEDLMNMTQDQAAYSEAKKSAGFKYHTFRGWLVAKAFQYYSEQSHSVVWPQNL